MRFYYRLGERADLHVDVMSSSSRAHLIGKPPKATGDLDDLEAELRKLVATACALSESQCETCGGQAKLHNLDGYWTTLCDEHLTALLATRLKKDS